MSFATATPLGIALLGVLLGMRHATDPDHVIAVTTILSRERRIIAATRIGIFWGLGHTATVLALGTAMIIFKFGIPARLGLAMEFTVAVVLILLGVGATTNWAVRSVGRFFGRPFVKIFFHSYHRHTRFGTILRHSHVNRWSQTDVLHIADIAVSLHDRHCRPAGLTSESGSRRRLLKSFGVGLVHGLAGSAAIALLVLGAIPNPVWETLFLVIFCVGVIIGMGLITTAIGVPLIFTSRRMANIHSALVTSAGLISFSFGVFLAYQISLSDRLFGGTPIWNLH